MIFNCYVKCTLNSIHKYSDWFKYRGLQRQAPALGYGSPKFIVGTTTQLRKDVSKVQLSPSVDGNTEFGSLLTFQMILLSFGSLAFNSLLYVNRSVRSNSVVREENVASRTIFFRFLPILLGVHFNVFQISFALTENISTLLFPNAGEVCFRTLVKILLKKIDTVKHLYFGTGYIFFGHTKTADISSPVMKLTPLASCCQKFCFFPMQ